MDLQELEQDVAKNFFDFVRKEISFRLFPRQIQLAAEFLGDWCTDCNPDMQLRDESYEWIQDNVVLRQNGVCPMCGSTQAPGQNRHAALSVGQRGGKTIMSTAISLYVEHLALCGHYGIPDKTLVNAWIAVSQNSGRDSMVQVNALRSGSPWFIKYVSTLASENMAPSISDVGCQYHHTGLVTRVVSADATVIDDVLPYFAILDEAAWFDGPAGTCSLAAVLKAVNNSMTPVRKSADIWDSRYVGGKVVALSAPNTKNDSFDKLLKIRDDQHYSRTLPSWNMNPRLSHECLFTEFQRDPYRANRDFGCRFIRE